MGAVDSVTFLDNLKKSRLLDDEQLARVSHIARAEPADDLPTALVADGLLTPLQAKRVASGDTRGLVLGPYRVLEEVGRGGMGRVYQAVHTVMGRTVALKLMAPEMAEDPRSRERFLREVRSVTRLSHSNIVLAYDANEADGILYLAMEYVAGTTLSGVVRTEGPLPVNRACEYIRQAALGLDHAHLKGLVHRDIKPQNLLIPRPADVLGGERSEGQSPALVKIADFGLARLLGPQTIAETAAGQTAFGFMGTPDYAAPEQCRDSRSADIRSDLYSLGCTLFYCLIGRPPFGGDTAMDVLVAHISLPAPRADEIRTDVPAGLADVIARALEKDPGRRYQTPGEFALALAPWCVGGVASASRAAVRVVPPADAGATRFIESPAAMTPRPSAGSGGAGRSATEATRVVGSVSTPTPAPALAASDRSSAVTPWGSKPELAPAVPAPTAAPEAAPGPANAPSTPLPVALANWIRVIRTMTRFPTANPESEPAYQVLHRTVLEGCAWEAKSADAETQQCLRQLVELVRPWVSLSILARTDSALLIDLAEGVSELGRSLGYRLDSTNWAGWVVALFLVSAAAPFVVSWTGTLPIAALPSAEDGVSLLRRAFGSFANQPMFWVGLGCVAGVVLVLLRLLRRER